MKNFIKRIENQFDIEMIKSEEPIDFKNTYTTDEDGNITTLRLQGIPMNTLDFLLPISDNLEDLFLQDCEINTIKSISVFKQLKKLDLSINPLSNLEGIENLVNLQELDLSATDVDSDSKFANIQYLQNLCSLSLDYTEIKSIQGLEHLKKLKKLNLRKTKIISFEDIEELDNINHIDLTSCFDLDFNRLGLERMKNLEKLNLSCCIVESFEGLKKMTNLKQLLLNSASEIKKIEYLDDLKKLEVLDLSETEISKIEGLEGLSNLTMLNLATNNISKIEGIKNLKNLEYIDLRNNKFSVIEEDSFIGIEKECIVDIGFNDVIDYNIKNPKNIKIVYNHEGGGLNLEPLSFAFGDIENIEKYCKEIKEEYLNRIKGLGFSSSLTINDFSQRIM
ncbi:leucine-rich repeat domain-containing protein [Flavobacterium aestivum]|uniref:leucine-rich repeat domain-containing protein n=1 Tax=Flavobacterium aestivum TaxID=3003257 RepID=UPI002482963A|nr:leucine-rich repeat domain-containing protein [Flavobacterium aestivum]